MTTSSLGTLTLDVIAKTGSFERGMTRAERSSAQLNRKLKKDMREARQSLQKYATVATGVAAGVAGVAVAYANSAREISNLSQIANVSTTEFQRMAAGARTVGIEQEKLSDILKDVNDRVGDFIQTGGGPMADFFENIAPKVGVTAEQFRKLGGKDALLLYVDSLKKAGLNQQDMTFYMEAMASDTTALLPLLENGGRALEEWGNKAERAGAIMSESTVASATELSVAMMDLEMAGKGLSNQFMMAVIPSISETAKELNVFLGDTENLEAVIDAAKGGAILFASVMSGRVAASLLKITGGARAASLAYGILTTSMAANARGGRALSLSMAAVAVKANIMTGAVNLSKRALFALGGPVGIAVGAASMLYAFGSSADDTATRISNLASEVRSLTAELQTMSVAEAKAARVKLDTKMIEASDNAAEIKESIAKLENRKKRPAGARRGNALFDRGKELSDLTKEITLRSGELSTNKKLQEKISADIARVEKHIQEASFVGPQRPSSAITPVGPAQGTIEFANKQLEAAKKAAATHRQTLGNLEQQLKLGYITQDKYNSQLSKAKLALTKVDGASELYNESTKKVVRSGGVASKKVKGLSGSYRELKKSYDDIGESYDSLKKTLSSNEDNRLATLNAQLQVIEKMRDAQKLGKVNVSNEELDSARKGVMDKAFNTNDMPMYQAPQAQLGGAFGELANIEEQRQKMAEWRTEKLDGLRQFYADKESLASEYAARKLEIEEKLKAQEEALQQASSTAQLAAGSQMFGALAGMAKKHAGEQSGIYKAMFAMQKAFAIASAMVNIQQAISEAGKLPFPENLPAMVTVATNMGRIVSSISSIAMPNGMAHDGIDSVPKTGTWLLEKGERVVTSKTSAKLDATLARLDNGGGGKNLVSNVTINYSGDGSKEESHQQMNEFSKFMKERNDAAMEEWLAKKLRPGEPLYDMINRGQ